MIVNIEFDAQWIYSDFGIHSNTVSKIIHKIGESVLDCEVKEQHISDCKLEVSTTQSGQEVYSIIGNILKDSLGNDISKCLVEVEGNCSFSQFPLPEAEKEATNSGKSLSPALNLHSNIVDDNVLKTIDELIGLDEFKSVCHDIVLRIPAIKRNNTEQFFFSQAFLFSVNAGNGFHTAIHLLEKLLLEAELFDRNPQKYEYSLPIPSDNELLQKINSLKGSLENYLSEPSIVSIDISAWIHHTSEPLFKDFLMYIFKCNKCSLIVFRLPYVKPSLFEELLEDLQDIISTKPVLFQPYSTIELRMLADKLLSSANVSMGNDAYPEFDSRIEAEKQDGCFYGIHTVRKIVGEYIQNLELSRSRSNQDRIITKELATIGIKKNNISIGSELSFDSLIGIEPIAEQLQQIIQQILFAKETGISSKPCMHMFFIGNPGTGKTTVARLLGQELKKAGVLRIGKLYEHHARDLCGEYVGQTAPKTTRICEQAYGSLLFIDEAYSLASESNNDYGREAVDTLIAQMENHFDDLVVIFAGYPDEMEKLMGINPGMRSRIPYTVNFPNYTRNQLFDIFKSMSSRDFSSDPGLYECAKSFFDSLPDTVITDRSFGNARFVRNIYEKTWGAALQRGQKRGTMQIVLTAEDFNRAISDIKVLEKKQMPPIGFSI